MSTSHVSTDSAESFRIDHDLNVSSATVQGTIHTTFDLMRYTFGAPKALAPGVQIGKSAIEWRMCAKVEGTWMALAVVRL